MCESSSSSGGNFGGGNFWNNNVGALADLPCCPQGAGTGGDVHMFYEGKGTGIGGDLSGKLVFFDDNHLVGSGITNSDLDAVPPVYSKIDHYAVDWFEVRPDGTWGAIVSERKAVCMWPQATVATQVYVVGSLVAASLRETSSQSLRTPVGCNKCRLNETWHRYKIFVDYDKLASECTSFGGLHWEAMRYVASVSQSITRFGFTGAIGDRATFSTQCRLSRDLPEPTLLDIFASSPIYYTPTAPGQQTEITGPSSTLDKLTILEAQIESWKIAGIIEASAETARRLAVFDGMARAAHPDDVSECCSANDIEYLNGGCCPGPNTIMCPNGECCPDRIVYNGKQIDLGCSQDGKCMTEDYFCAPPT
jgi:hypothetical protein